MWKVKMNKVNVCGKCKWICEYEKRENGMSENGKCKEMEMSENGICEYEKREN